MDTLQDVAYLQFQHPGVPKNAMPHLRFLNIARYNFLYNYFKDVEITPDQNKAPFGFFNESKSKRINF